MELFDEEKHGIAETLTNRGGRIKKNPVLRCDKVLYRPCKHYIFSIGRNCYVFDY